MRVETDALKALANKKAASADLLLCKTPGKKRASGKALFPKGVFFCAVLRSFAHLCAVPSLIVIPAHLRSYRPCCRFSLYVCALAVLRLSGFAP